MMPRWLRHGDLRPVGNPILLQASGSAPEWPGYVSLRVNSGTAALALALIVARTSRPEATAPAVLLPAYGCPDLVAAAEFAQLRPVLVDIDEADPGYSSTALERAITPDVVAVVAVNFLGIRERLVELKNLLAMHSRAVLIEDNAQWFPEPLDAPALVGDLACLSFGRGKPVSLLGGGALLMREGSNFELARSLVGAAPAPSALFSAKVRVFNGLVDRRWYWSINRNPAFSVGQTIFKPLAGISAMDATRTSLLGANARAYLRRPRDVEAAWTKALSQSKQVMPLASAPERYGRLLRYPVLCRDAAMRDVLLARLHEAGLGESAMYRRPLAQVDGVGSKVQVAGACPGATAFAARLLTLPTHEQVRQRDIDATADLLAS